ncbi:rubrerythrin [Candidatus Bathyarchaeota archaeon]|nr:rubrerythrin [Candidatus Bathyarchaeota archaeon]MBS7613760.1 rubrerythrin [Candidatus Bathyarchaeota archaeon]MBS7617287.1 rubrerythrin [Candidatus Bathyarchaeota archaeon]
MLSQIPVDFKRLKKEELDREILRIGMIAELDAINLYEQLAAVAEDENLRRILLDIAKEEKTHFGEFQTLLLRKDKEQVEELEKGKEEVDELVK